VAAWRNRNIMVEAGYSGEMDLWGVGEVEGEGARWKEKLLVC
jgi:hypothetical protein